MVILAGVLSGAELEVPTATAGKLPGILSLAAEVLPAEVAGTGEPSRLPAPWNTRAPEDFEDDEGV